MQGLPSNFREQLAAQADVEKMSVHKMMLRVKGMRGTERKVGGELVCAAGAGRQVVAKGGWRQDPLGLQRGSQPLPPATQAREVSGASGATSPVTTPVTAPLFNCPVPNLL